MGVIDKKINWVAAARRFSLAARANLEPLGWEVGFSEPEMVKIQEWCESHNCGRRTGFDIFQFKNKKEMTMFLLRWGS
jgi:hypothetical protein